MGFCISKNITNIEQKEYSSSESPLSDMKQLTFKKKKFERNNEFIRKTFIEEYNKRKFI